MHFLCKTAAKRLSRGRRCRAAEGGKVDLMGGRDGNARLGEDAQAFGVLGDGQGPLGRFAVPRRGVERGA